MEVSYIDTKKCPHCNKEFEIELKHYAVKILLRKESKSKFPPEMLEAKKLNEQIKKKGLVKKARKLISFALEKKRGFSYKRFKAEAEKQGIENEEDVKKILRLLVCTADLCQPRKDFYRPI